MRVRAFRAASDGRLYKALSMLSIDRLRQAALFQVIKDSALTWVELDGTSDFHFHDLFFVRGLAVNNPIFLVM